ncbi:TPA: EpsG family protein [Klebsiella quasipneumoniae subsp. similipneumoniae]
MRITSIVKNNEFFFHSKFILPVISIIFIAIYLLRPLVFIVLLVPLLSFFKTTRYFNIVILFFLVFASGFISFSIKVDGDVKVYIDIINDLLSNGFNSNEIKGFEFFYAVIVCFLNLFFNDPSVIYLLTLFIEYFLFAFVCYKLNKQFCCILFSLSFLYSLVITVPYLQRQFFATCFILLGCLSTNNKNKLFYYVLSLISHGSSILIIFFAELFSNKCVNKKIMLSLLVLSLIIMQTMNAEYMYEIALYFNNNDFMSDFTYKFNFYLQDSEGGYPIYIVILSFMVYVFFIKNSDDRDTLVNLFLTSCLLVFSFSHVPVLYNRMGFLICNMPTLLLPSILKSQLKFKLLGIMTVCFMIALTYYQLNRLENGETYATFTVHSLLDANYLELLNHTQ